MDASSSENIHDPFDTEAPTRRGSKLSLGSSPSVLSTDEPLDIGDGPLTPTNRLEDDDDSLLGMGDSRDASPDALLGRQNRDGDDIGQFSASPLSSVPDDFPLSRSTSPEPAQTRKRKKDDMDDSRSEEEMTCEVAKKQKYDIPNDESKVRLDGNILHAAAKTSGPSKAKPRSKSRRRAAKPRDREPRTRQRGGKTSQGLKPESNPMENEENMLHELSDKENNKDAQEESEGNSIEQIQVDTADESTKRCPAEEDDHRQRHTEALEALTHIEIEFARLREKMYQEKMKELNVEAEMISNGTHPEMIALMEKIETKKQQRINSAEAWRRQQHANYQQEFEGVEHMAHTVFIYQKGELRAKVLSHLNGQKWSMDAERAKLDQIVTHGGELPDKSTLETRKYAQQVESIELQSIKDNVGFPVAPKPAALAKQHIEEDLIALGLAKPIVHKPARTVDPKATLDTARLPISGPTNISTGHPLKGVRTTKEQLYYHGQVFNKGDYCTVVDVNAGRYTAKLLSTTDVD
ncbi:Transcriptional regulatory protein, partial [Apophysomyces sp. BC1034]